MDSMPETNEFRPNQRVLNAFVPWIEQNVFDRQHARNWARLYRADPEAAMCEATVWAVLNDCNVTVAPNADLTGRKAAPDFLCHKDGSKFYVEATCIRSDTATRGTALASIPCPGSSAGWYRPLNDAIFQECVNKTGQCANLDAPCVLAVGTFHHQASVLGVQKTFIEWLLTGETRIAWDFDPERGECVGEPYQITDFRSAAFTRRSKLEGIEHARHPISALLVGGFGCQPVRVYGVVHPNPVREFDPIHLHRIPFCLQRIDVQTATVSTEWVQTPDDWHEQARRLG